MRSVAGIDFGYGRHSFSATWRYTSGVVDDQGFNLNTTGTGAVIPTVTTRIRAFSVFDFQYGLNFGSEDRYQLAVGVLNAFNTAPGFARGNGYLPSLADAFGSQVYARVALKF